MKASTHSLNSSNSPIRRNIMALDGVVISNIVNELNEKIVGGKIDKVNQPEKDELILSIRSNKTTYKLLLTVEASAPRIHLTNISKKNPLAPPTFCMLLRKHLSSGKIVAIKQPNFERIIILYVEHLNELGDLCTLKLIIEMMGRHSNIILCDQDDKILDSIKRVNSFMSSVREVVPGRQYVLPPSKNKVDPTTITTYMAFSQAIHKPVAIHDALYQSLIGISPLLSEEICYMANINSSTNIELLETPALHELYNAFITILSNITTNNYQPMILIDEEHRYMDFYAFPLLANPSSSTQQYDSISELLDDFYINKSSQMRIKQKSVDIRKLVQTNLDRCSKKYSLQLRQLEDTKDKDQFKIKGELINANLYQIKEGDKKVTLNNYYTNEEITINLDPTLTPSQNAQKFFNKYNKKKRTLAALTDQIEETKKELSHLESIKYAIEFAKSEEDIADIRTELVEAGYIKFKNKKSNKKLEKSQPMHYISSDGFHIYVGKNNLQNEELSLKFASNSDWWFHAKEVPGSHVIVKALGKDLPDKTFEEAAALAAFYSKASHSTKVTVDYTLKKNLIKPNSSPPGYVIYHTNYSLVVKPTIDNIENA
jgi:predicted ribosome quality control (RQC) complex YloA/Tae2 family protein